MVMTLLTPTTMKTTVQEQGEMRNSLTYFQKIILRIYEDLRVRKAHVPLHSVWTGDTHDILRDNTFFPRV